MDLKLNLTAKVTLSQHQLEQIIKAEMERQAPTYNVKSLKVLVENRLTGYGLSERFEACFEG